MGSISEVLAAEANKTVRAYKQALSEKSGPKVIMPGGIAHDASKYLGALYKFRNATSIFNKPEDSIEHPEPGYHYAWAEFHIGGGRPREGALRTEAFIRKGHYIPVEPNEMKADTEIPYSKGVTKKRVEMYDVMLVKIPPRAWEELYDIREALGVQSVTRHFEKFYNDSAAQGAEADIEANVEPLF
jgi:hypothetical protein